MRGDSTRGGSIPLFKIANLYVTNAYTPIFTIFLGIGAVSPVLGGEHVTDSRTHCTTSPHSGTKPSFSSPWIFTGARRNPVTCSANQVSEKGQFGPVLRASGRNPRDRKK